MWEISDGRKSTECGRRFWTLGRNIGTLSGHARMQQGRLKTRKIENNKKGFFMSIAKGRKTTENLGPLLNEVVAQVMEDT